MRGINEKYYSGQVTYKAFPNNMTGTFSFAAKTTENKHKKISDKAILAIFQLGFQNEMVN